MKDNDYIVSLEGVTDREEFFSELLTFYAPIEGVLTIWGRLPKDIQNCLDLFKAPCFWMRRVFFNQSEWHLTTQTLNVLEENFCDENLLRNLNWGLVKSEIPLGLCRNWDDINLYGSDLIEETKLFTWLDQLKSKGLVQSYEKICVNRQHRRSVALVLIAADAGVIPID
jgi:hypothetical protein